MTVPRQAIVQQAYYVSDIDEAIDRWHSMLGIGPFFLRRHIALATATYRGGPTRLDISAAYVQAGPIQLELVTQHGDEPSGFRDMYPASGSGLHHVAVIPDDYAALVAHYAALGCPVTTELTTASGRGAAYVDTRARTGHMLEIYRPTDGLRALYREVADAALHWDRRTLVIDVDPHG